MAAEGFENKEKAKKLCHISKMGIKAVVCEEHNDVLPYLYKLIGSKKLPLTGLTMVHFDSHPDLLIPKDLQADEVWDKQCLFDKLSIENWIMPAVYAGHIDTVVWVKPTWSNQISEGCHKFCVGKDKNTGCIRLSCPENYFLGEMLYVPNEQLENKKLLTVHVVTFYTSITNDVMSETEDKNMDRLSHDVNECHSPENPTTSLKKRRLEKNRDDIAEKLTAPEKLVKVVLDALHPHGHQCTSTSNAGHYILDIDLDFFSTANPFKSIYSGTQYMLIQQLYEFTPPKSKSKECIEECVAERRKQLRELEQAFTALSKGDKLPTETLLTTIKEALLQSLVKDINQNGLPSGECVDWLWLHEVGCGCDDTELPHHISDIEHVKVMVDNLSTCLKLLPKPSVITIARSSTDDYCPKDQVNSIQEFVEQMLKGIYGDLEAVTVLPQ